MIFISKRNGRSQQLTGIESCISIIGLFLAIGILSGLAALIYGLITGRSSGTAGGAIVLGISVLLTIIFILLIVFCPINNNVDSNMNQQQHHHHHHQQQRPNDHITHINASQERTTFASSIPVELTDSKNYNFDQQLTPLPSQPSTSDFLNQSGSSVNNHNQY